MYKQATESHKKKYCAYKNDDDDDGDCDNNLKNKEWRTTERVKERASKLTHTQDICVKSIFVSLLLTWIYLTGVPWTGVWFDV